MWQFSFKPEVAIEALLFFCQQAKKSKGPLSFMQIAKLLFYADKLHLKKYGRPITGDTYIKMEHGPNPSHIYDYLKDVRDRLDQQDDLIRVKLEPNPPHAPKPFVIPLRETNVNVFSDSEREVLEEVFSLHGSKSAKELRDLSHHEKAWQEAELEMAYEDFMDPEDETMKSYIQESQDDWDNMRLTSITF